MEIYKNTYSAKKYATVSERIFDLYKESELSENEHEFIGGIISDTKLSWVALGPYLQVFYTKTCEIRSLWCFGAVVKEPNAQVVCVHELKVPFKNVSLLVVGLKYGSHNGMVCIYDSSCAKILRAIEIPEEVTSLHVVSAGYDSKTFPGPLSAFDGIISVGTAGGAVFIIDLCKELISDARKISGILDIRNELRPCQLKILSTRDVFDLEKHKMQAEQEGTHLAILLNERETSSKHFGLKTPCGRNVIFAAKEEVTVSTLHYAPQLCSIFVGYNFGALQIWNLLSMTLEYTSPVYEEKIPVSHIAIQEPVDDPRAFCYFWAIYSCTGQYHNVFPLAALYSLNYESKDYHEGYGHIYQSLQSCAIRFQANLRTIDSSVCAAPTGANCIRLHSYSKGANNTNSTLSVTSSEESCTLCMMVWNVKCEEHKVHTFMSFFDLNQWYKEQMPSLPYQEQCKNYMTNVCLSDITGSSEYALDAYIDPSTIDPFIGAQKLEEHYRPSALAYNVIALTEIEVCSMVNLGVQRYFFKELEDIGPLALMHPEEHYTNARIMGLSPLFVDLPVEPPFHQQCEVLLSIALERKMLQWLCKCATSWGNGGLKSVGLSLELLLNWAWERTRVLKSNADRCCTCLFDYSGTKLDGNLHSLITACRVQFGTMKDLFTFVVKNCDAFLSHPEIIKQQLGWLQRNYAYFNVIGWMINLNLLPETKQTYPVEQIRYNYRQRRDYLKSLESVSETNRHYLFIDYLIDKETLQSEWKEDGTGEYPPGTLQTLLRCYFNNDLDIKAAHVLIAYTLLDLVMYYETSTNENVTAAMIKFPQIFDLSMSTTKAIQSFWHLDHGQLAPAVNQLSSRMIHPQDIQQWQHKFIINALKLQKEYRLALMYLKSRNTRGDKDDVKNFIQLNVRNKMLFEALCIQRRHADNELLETFFVECMNAGFIMELVNFNFTKEEERMLLEFLDNYSYAKREEFKTIYFVRRGRFLDFYMRQDKNTADRHAMPRLVRNTLDAILPEVTKKVIDTCLELKNLNYNDTKALSAYVCDPSERAKFQNNFVKACVVNCKDSWSSNKFVTEDDFPFMRPPFSKNKYEPKKILYPKNVATILQRQQEHEPEVEPPTKRMRLSNSNQTDDIMNMTSIQTMHFQRSNLSCQSNTNLLNTPQSILKTPVPNSHRGDSTTPEDLDNIHTSKLITPKISARPSVCTPSVRFAELSSSSSNTRPSITLNPVPMTSMYGSEILKETSSTAEYYSPDTSPEHEDRSRKRKLTKEEREEPVSVLRSTSFQCIGNETATKFLESMRNSSFADESLPTVEQVVKPFTMPQQLDKSDVFVFTGDDAELPNKILTPKSRDTYQKSASPNTTKTDSKLSSTTKKSLSRQVLEANTSKVLQENEVSVESKTVTYCEVKEISRNVSNVVVEKRMVEQTEVSDSWKQVLIDTDETEAVHEKAGNSTCEKSDYIDDLIAEEMEIDEALQDDKSENHAQSGEKTTDTSIETLQVDVKEDLKRSLTPSGRRSYQTTPGASPDHVNVTPQRSVRSDARVNKTFIETNNSRPVNCKSIFESSAFIDYFASDINTPAKPTIEVVELVVSGPKTREYTDNLQDAEVSNITKNLELATASNGEEKNGQCGNEEVDPDKVVQTPTASNHSSNDTPEVTPQKSQPIMSETVIEISDSPLIHKSYFERTGFIDYFTDSYESGNENNAPFRIESRDAVTESFETGKNTEHEEDVEEKQDNNVEVEEIASIDEEDEDEVESVNIDEDSTSSFKYFIDPVMNNYNANQDLVVNADEARNSMQQDTLPSEILPLDQFLNESMDSIDENNSQSKSGNKTSIDLNKALVEIISIPSSTDSENEKSSDRTSNSELLDSADVAFIVDSESELGTKSTSESEKVTTSDNTSTHSKENLDESVNEVNLRKASSKTDIPIIEETDKQSESNVGVQGVHELSTIIEEVEPVVSQPEMRSSVKANSGSPTIERRSTRKLMESPALTITLRSRRGSASAETGAPAHGTSEIEKPVPKAITRTRSLSVDTPLQVIPKRIARTRSVDAIAEEKKVKVVPKKRGRKTNVTAICEEEEPTRRSSARKSESDSEPDFLETRRLTRRQKHIIEEKSRNDDSNSMDRLQLMDKDDFTGKSDPDEVNLLQRSPTSSIASSSAAENARKRADSSDKSKVMEVVVTKKPRGRPRKAITPDPVSYRNSSSEQSFSETSRKVRAGSVDSGSRAPGRNTHNDMEVIFEERELSESTPKRGRPRKNKY